MQLVNSIIGKKLGISIVIVLITSSVFGQSNSPFSRYGIGDLSNSFNIVNRGMGGANIASTNTRFVNSNNPASYSYLGKKYSEKYSKLGLGQPITFDVGTEFQNISLKQVAPLNKYNSQNLVFNYMQFATQLSKKGNWGMSFGLQPVSNTNYKVQLNKRITNVDSAQTVFDGSGGAYKGYVGTGFRKDGFSFGFNTGYLFGKKFTTTNLRLLNDSVQYYESSSNSKLNFGNFFLHTGFLYDRVLVKKGEEVTSLSIGATYELKNRMNTSTDIERLVFDTDNTNNPGSNIDTIEYKSNINGNLIMPTTYGFGIRLAKVNEDIKVNNMFAASFDFSTTKWSQYRVNNAIDQVKDVWQIRSGFEFRPVYNAKSYWSRGVYRAGFNFGQDYITAGGNLPTYTVSIGSSLPMGPELFDPTISEATRPYLNIALEFGKRGNNSVNISESFARVALSVSLADIWFQKRKYD